MPERPKISDKQIRQEMINLNTALLIRLAEKGKGSFASSHEILGIITEEYQELIEAIHSNSGSINVVKELEDIAVACVFACACIKNDKLDWL